MKIDWKRAESLRKVWEFKSEGFYTRGVGERQRPLETLARAGLLKQDKWRFWITPEGKAAYRAFMAARAANTQARASGKAEVAAQVSQPIREDQTTNLAPPEGDDPL